MKNKLNFLFPLFLVSYESATYLSNDMYLPALPAMRQYFNLDEQTIQLTLTLWFAGLALTPLFFGAASDRFGRRPILLWGGFVFFITNIICATFHDFYWILIARFIQGLVIPSMIVSGYAVIHESFEHKEAIRILAMMGSVTILAPALGPLLGSVLLLYGTWKFIFWFIAMQSGIALIGLYFYMPETMSIENRIRMHLPSLLASYKRVLINARFMTQSLTLAAIFGGFIIWITVSPLLILEQFHYTPIQFGLFQAFIFIFYILGNQSVDYLIDRIGVQSLVTLGMQWTLIGGVLTAIASLMFPDNLYPYVVAMSLYSLGTSFCFAPLNRLVIETSDEPMGIRVAFFNIILMSALTLMTLIGAWYYDTTIYSLAFLTAFCGILAGLMRWATPLNKVH